MPAMKVSPMSGSPFGSRVQLSLDAKGLAVSSYPRRVDAVRTGIAGIRPCNWTCPFPSEVPFVRFHEETAWIEVEHREVPMPRDYRCSLFNLVQELVQVDRVSLAVCLSANS